MYSSSFSVADLGRPPQPTPGRQRNLHGSQSHSNFHFGSSMNLNQSYAEPGPAGGVPGGQQTQQYMPGYLLAASQGQPPPAQVRDFTLQPLESEKTLKRAASAYGRSFGEDSLMSVQRPSPKGRSPRTPMSVDDENAPPTLSISESQYAGSSGFGQQSKLTNRASTGGFHPLSKSHTPFTPTSSIGTTYERNNEDGFGGPSNGPGYSVTVFGFLPKDRDEALQLFLVDDATVPQDGSEGSNERNYAEIIFQNQWDAVRAVRKNGTLTMHGGNILLGARWTDPSQEPASMSPPTIVPESPLQNRFNNNQIQQSSGNGTPTPLSGFPSSRTVRLKPSASAFRSQTIATTTPSNKPEGPADEFGIADHARRLESNQAPQQNNGGGGMLGTMRSMVGFGW